MQVRRLTIAAVLFACGCDYTGDWLFAGEVQGVPGVWHLEDEEGRLVVPRVVQTFEELQAATIYAEVGPSGTTELGGVTIEFMGTGGDICVWVDPETAYWNQAVAVQPSVQGEPWTYPEHQIFDERTDETQYICNNCLEWIWDEYEVCSLDAEAYAYVWNNKCHWRC